MLYEKNIQRIYQYDVVVAGGGPAGVCAAVSAARQGAKTLLIERFGILGGMMTSGHVDPILGNVAPGTMYDEIISRMTQLHPGVEPQITRNGVEQHVDPEEAKILLLNLVKESGAEYFLQSSVVDVIQDEDEIKGVVISTPTGLAAVYGKCVIDCTGDGFLAAAAGAEYKIGRESDGLCQPNTIEFVVNHVDEASAITCFGGSDPVRLKNGGSYVELCKQANLRGELPPNVTIVRLHKTFYSGERSVNATQVNQFNSLSLAEIAEADLLLRNQITCILGFLRKNVPGYEKCRIKSSASTLGVRETRRIIGEYVLRDSDIEQGRKFEDVVVHNAWFLIDIHPPNGGGQAEKFSHPAKPYDIPMRSLIPLKLENFLVAGRCISGTHRAHASYRVMAICMAIGEAAGVMAALCADKEISPRRLNSKEVQQILISRGIHLFQ